MLVVGPKGIKTRFGQSPAGASELHDVGALCRCDLRGDQANDLVKLEGAMHPLSRFVSESRIELGVLFRSGV